MGRVVGCVVLLLVAVAGCADDADDEAAPVGASTTTAPSTTTTTVSASDGCSEVPAVRGLVSEAPGDVVRTFPSGGRDRSYRLGVPASYEPDVPAPLILSLHGSGSDAFQQSIYTDLPRRAGDRGMITVTPDAVDGQWELAADGSDDDFLVALVADVMDRYCVDVRRVHVTGISLGAWKASQEVCRHPDLFASAVLGAEEVRPPDCPPTAVLAFHGTADAVVPYGEGADAGVTVTGPNAGLPGARSNIADWAEGAGCGPEPAIEAIGDDVERWAFPDCDPGLDVELHTIRGGGHTWPGADITVGPTTQTIDATELALDFFDAHPRPERER